VNILQGLDGFVSFFETPVSLQSQFPGHKGVTQNSGLFLLCGNIDPTIRRQSSSSNEM